MAFKIGRVSVSNNKTVVIAEAGVNHLGRLDYAERLIKAASRSGADIIKFQTYKAEKLTTKNAPRFWSWEGEKIKDGSQYDSYSNLDSFGKEEYTKLIKMCEKNRIEFMSTPFDEESVDMLISIGMKGFKIASCDINNFPLLEYIARKKKPILLSTGASNLSEIKKAVKLIERNGNNKIVIMHCILCYPTAPEDSNLGALVDLKRSFPKYLIGLSDHTLGTMVASSSVLLGSRVIEKHFTFDKKLPISADHWLSLDEEDLTKLILDIRFMEKVFGQEKKERLICEEQAFLYARRSIVAKFDIEKGEKIKLNMLEMKRPGTGIPPNLLRKVVNKKAKNFISKDQIISYKDII